MAAGNGGYTPKKYRTITYKGERDPSMDDLHSIAANEGVNDAQLAVMSGLSPSTIKNWGPKGKTRRPTHICLAAAFGALGWEYVLQQKRKINVEEELIAGQRWAAAQERSKKRREGG